MRTRVIRWTAPTSAHVTLKVQRWCAGQWESVLDFQLCEAEQANEFARRLSASERVPTEMAMYDNGEKMESRLPLILERLRSGEQAITAESAP